MENTHLTKLLSTLTTKELKLLKKWVASPFFNQRKDVIQLLDLYLKYRKKEQSFPSKSEIFNHLFPNIPYDDHKIRMVMSFLNRLTERFLIYQQQQELLLTDKLILLRVYRERKLEKPYLKITKEIEKIFNQVPQRNANYYRLKYRFYQEKLKFEELTKRFVQKENLQKVADNLDISFLLEKSRESLLIQEHEKMITEKYDLGLYDKLVIYLEEHPNLKEHPVIVTYYAAAQVHLYKDERSVFDTYYNLLEENHTLFSKEELFELYNIATNYLARRYVQGETKCLQEMFPVHKRQIELGLYDKEMPHYAFKNIVSTGLNSDAYDWVEQFIKDYTPRLAKEHQISMPNFAQASLAWRRGEYEQALQLLAAAKFEDTLHNMSARMMITKIYYDMRRWNALQQHLKAYEVFVRRLKNKEYHKEKYLEMILFAQKVFRLNPYDKKEINKLIETLENNPSILEKKWLMRCLENVGK